MSDLVRKAHDYAIRCHAGTNHQYDGKPYETHLEMVWQNALKYSTLLPADQRETATAAAWVHDVIEDTRQTYNDVARNTSADVAEIAYALTNEKGRTRKERANAAYYAGIRANPTAVYVKLCDRLANVTYSRITGSRMLDLYRKEQRDFRRELWMPDFAAIFAEIEIELGVSDANA